MCILSDGLILRSSDKRWWMLCVCIFSDRYRGITVITDLEWLPSICNFSIPLFLPPVLFFFFTFQSYFCNFIQGHFPSSSSSHFSCGPYWFLLLQPTLHCTCTALALVPMITPYFLSITFLFLSASLYSTPLPLNAVSRWWDSTWPRILKERASQASTSHWHRVVWRSTAWHIIAQHSMAQRGIVRHITAWFRVAYYSIAGMAYHSRHEDNLNSRMGKGMRACRG